jgi:Aspartyl/Asparaginyl beta-hydroxylase
MRYFQKLAEGIDVVPILAALSRQPELWNQETLRTTHPETPHSQVSDIWIRFNDLTEWKKTGDPSSIIDQHESKWYPAAAKLPQLRPILFGVMQRVEGERLGRVIITRLPPGGHITPHEDSGDHAAYYSRYQLLLANNPGSTFKCGGEEVYMRPGELWFFRNEVTHEVVNNSTEDRLTLIIDIRQSQ